MGRLGFTNKPRYATEKSSSVVADRNKYIGGSDLAQVTSMTTALTVASKKKKPQEEFQSIYTEFGNIAEPLIRDRISQIHYGGDFAHDEGLYIQEREGKLGFRGNLDIDDTHSKAVGEIKTVSEAIDGSRDWTKKVENYKVQCGFYQMLAGYNKGYIAYIPRPEYLIDRPFSEWTVKELSERRVEVEELITVELLDKLKFIDCNLDNRLLAEINKRIELFDKAWESLDKKKESTGDKTEQLKVYSDNLQKIAELTKQNEEIMETLSNEYDDIASWEIGDNTFVFTPASTGVRKSFDSRAFSKEHPDMYNAFIKESTVNRKATIKIK